MTATRWFGTTGVDGRLEGDIFRSTELLLLWAIRSRTKQILWHHDDSNLSAPVVSSGRDENDFKTSFWRAEFWWVAWLVVHICFIYI